MDEKKIAAIDEIAKDERRKLEKAVEIRGRLLGKEAENIFLRVGGSTLEIPTDAIEDIEGELTTKSTVVVMLAPGTTIKVSSEVRAEDLSMATMYDQDAFRRSVYLDQVFGRLLCGGVMGGSDLLKGGAGNEPMYVANPLLLREGTGEDPDSTHPMYSPGPVSRRGVV